MGLPPAADHAGPAPDRAPVLRLQGRRHGSLHRERQPPPGDALGSRAGDREERAGDRLGQPADHLHAWHRRGHGPRERGDQGRPAQALDQGPAADLNRWRPQDHGAADLLRRGRQPLRGGARPPERVRLPAHGRDRHRGRDHALDGDHGDRPRHHAEPAPVRAPLQGPGPADLGPDHGRQPAPVPPHAGRPPGPHCAVPALRQGPLPRHRRKRAPGLRPGRLHPQRLLPARHLVRRVVPGRRHGSRRRPLQLHPQQRQDHDGRLQRRHVLLRLRPVRPHHPGLAGRVPGHVQADGRHARRHRRPPARARGAVQRPDAGVRHVSRDRAADVLQQDRPVDGHRCPDQRAEPAVGGLLRGHAHAERAQGGVPAPAADDRQGPPQHDRVGGSPQRPGQLRTGGVLPVPRGHHHLRTGPDRGPDRPEPRHQRPDLALEPERLEGDPGQPDRGARGRLAALPAAGVPAVHVRGLPRVPEDRRGQSQHHRLGQLPG